MNNSQFRKLVLDTPARQGSSSSPSDKTTQSRNGATPSALGSRMRSSIPMTPRTVAGYSSSNDFARQLAERNSSQTTKKFRSSAAPKGAKLPEGYVDRAKQRVGEEGEEDSEKVQRVKALEEMMKLQQIDEATFEKLREEILGDEAGVERAGLVKGLDRSMLERVKRGELTTEDVLEGRTGKREEGQVDTREEDVDDEFERLEEREVEAIHKEKEKKKGEMAPPALTGKKRNRDQILAELKAARLAAKEAAQPSLGSRFKKVGDRRGESRIERDSKGREVLITVDEDGNEKRKVRKVQVQKPAVEKGHGLLMPDKDAVPLGMDVPEILKPAEVEEEEDDIFEGAGDDYDPLADLEDEDSEEEGEEGEVSEPKEKKPEKESILEESAPGSMAPPPKPKQPTGPRNYFGESKPEPSSDTSGPKPMLDPTILAALKKASTLNPISKEAESEEEAAKAARRKKMVQQDDRDAQDMDMGFGSSRFADEEDFEEKKMKLSEWGSKDDDGDEGWKGDGKGKRKRGPKKRKGDANSAADVMKVLERRKAEK
ncbi:uncharacterized protein K444DRAFT_543824 [Hyaloscypha bicolor E]|uniref:RED-like N-terminal domain-containing protein n=1 Tax=Hyaloscypha bicolor E TaxID=1095630 RepID=A0A2J6SLF4_9HELO|nr:uncharacterized protein K444DRAFT_543824 [Hyaloscypha bicolor E]PMD51601.1 hypothetical protein K444DRAFT_543824 [Hyaloscypha bicolor E]